MDRNKLKFRVWQPVVKSWIRGLLIDENGELVFEHFGRIHKYEDKNPQIQQFTGYKDQEGKDVFEGDIIQIYNEDDEDPEWDLEIVVFKDAAFFWGDEFLYDMVVDGVVDGKVIGNVFEDQDLLK